MATIRPIIRDASFDPEALIVMSLAYDKAKALMKARDPVSREVLAIRIVTMASCGERDPDRLANEALNGFARLREEIL